MLLPQGQGRLAHPGGGIGRGRGRVIAEPKGRLASAAKLLHQMAHGARRQGQHLGDRGGGLTASPPLPDQGSDRDGHGPWHGDDPIASRVAGEALKSIVAAKPLSRPAAKLDVAQQRRGHATQATTRREEQKIKLRHGRSSDATAEATSSVLLCPRDPARINF
jgi:hypothetical protein